MVLGARLIDKKHASEFRQAFGDKTAETTEAKTRRMLNEMYAKQPVTPTASTKPPSMADNFKALGAGMARGTQRMIDQRKIIADKK